MKNEKRPYNSRARGRQALETKSRILDAAQILFRTKGFDQVTIQALALEAGVSVPTIYALFKTKRGVLQALIDHALPPEKFSLLVDNSMKEQHPIPRLQATAKLARQIYDAEKELMDILRGASVVSPELKELELERERRRYERQNEYVKMLMDEGQLSQNLTLQKSRDILWILTGRDLYRMCVVERGWSSDDYENWLSELLVKSLLRTELRNG